MAGRASRLSQFSRTRRRTEQQAAEECSFGAVGDDTPGREVCAGGEEEIESREGRRGTHPLTPANPRYCLGCQ